jgi:hypothetical protein
MLGENLPRIQVGRNMRRVWFVMLALAAGLLSASATAQVSTLTMGSNAEQVDGVDDCFTHEIHIAGTDLSPVSVTPPGGSSFVIPETGTGTWEFESDCFDSLAALEAVFPRDEVGTYNFVFGGTSDSDSLSYSSVAFPACTAVITAPSHGAVTSATPTIEWSVDCVLAPSSCHYALEVFSTGEGELVFENFYTDCPGNNSLSIPPGTLTPGITYLFWVELTAEDDGTPAMTDGFNNYTYFQSTQNSNQIEFLVDPDGFGRLTNVSTRGFVGTGPDVLIGGFITEGGTARVLVRARGPAAVPGFLEDPWVELRTIDDVFVLDCDNWRTCGSEQEITDCGYHVGMRDQDAAVIVTLDDGAYTPIVRGVGGTTGVGIVEAIELPAVCPGP